MTFYRITRAILIGCFIMALAIAAAGWKMLTGGGKP